MQVRKLFVGIDVSMKTLDVTALDVDEKLVGHSTSYENDPKGWTELVEALDSLTPKYGLMGCAMESTGRYHEGIARHLRGHSSAIEVHVLNPLATKRFSQAMLKDAKTDRIDSKLIALYLMRMKPEPVLEPTIELQALKEVTRRRRRLVEDRTLETNRLHAFMHRHYPGYQDFLGRKPTLSLLTVMAEMQSPQAIVERSAESIARISTAPRHVVGEKIAEALVAVAAQAPVKTLSEASELLIETSVRRLLELRQTISRFDACIEKMLADMPTAKFLLSVPGLGPVTVATVLAEVGDIRQFATADKFVGYCGLYPIVWESGQAKRTYRMSRKGNRWLKTALLVVSASARMNNPTIASFAERLKKRGKSTKAIGGALAAKLARIIWAIMTKNESWSPAIADRGREKAAFMLASATD